MTRRQRLTLAIGGGILGFVLLLAIVGIVVVQTTWFANFARNELSSTLEGSLGGRVEIGSLQIDLWHGAITLRNFIWHGTEASTDAPLARVNTLQLRLKLFSGIAGLVDLAYVGVDTPQVSVLVRPDGTTNIPQPKTPQQPSNGNGLETVVNLKVGQFEIKNGLLAYAQRKTPFAGRGENLQALLQYRDGSPRYDGRISIDPLVLQSGSNPPLRVQVRLPLTIERNAIRLQAASLQTGQSNIALNASLENLNHPAITGHLQAAVSLKEVQNAFALPLDTSFRGAPQSLTVDLGIRSDDQSKLVRIEPGSIVLGRTHLQASGSARDPNNPNSSANIDGTLALDELGRLLKLEPTELAGALNIHGTAALDAKNNYQVNGSIESEGLGLRNGSINVRDLRFSTPFHADPYLVSLDGLRFRALGGSLAVKLFLQNTRLLSVEGNLSNFSLPVLASVATGKNLGYDGVLSGSLNAKGDLQQSGTTGYLAGVNLRIVPGTKGVPVQGRINADYDGARDTIRVQPSFLSLPHSMLNIAGAVNQKLNLKLLSHNLDDFLPAANFGAAHPQTSLPVSLAGGGAANLQAVVSGQLSNPRLTATAALDRFAVEGRSFEHFGLDLNAARSHVAVENGTLRRATLQSNFDATLGLRQWSPVPTSPLRVNLSLNDSTIGDLLSLAGQSADAGNGAAQAEVHLTGTFGNPLGSASFVSHDGSLYGQGFQTINLQTQLVDQLITVQPLELVTDAGSLTAQARFQHPRNNLAVGQMQLQVRSTPIQLAQIEKLKQQNKGIGGTLQLVADAAGALREADNQTAFDLTAVNLDLGAHNLKVNNQEAGDFTANATTQSQTVNYRVRSDFAGSDIAVDGHTGLTGNYRTEATALIQKLSVAKALSIAGQSDIPASGDFSASAKVNGDIQAPDANLSFQLARAAAYGESIQNFTGTVHYLKDLVEIPSLQLKIPAGNVTMNGSFRHPANDFNSGNLVVDLSSSDVQLNKIAHVHQAVPTMVGMLHLGAGVTAVVRTQNGKQQLEFSRLNADVEATKLQMNGGQLGRAALTAKSDAGNVHYQFDSNLAQSVVHAAGVSKLSGDYPTQATLSFKNIRYKNIAPFISEEPGVEPSFDALVEGGASVNGPVLDQNRLTARLQLDRLEAQASPARSPTGAPPGKTVTIQNKGPMVVALNGNNVTVQQFHLEGPNSNFDVSGGLNLANDRAPINLTLASNLDLAILGDIDHDIYSRGAVSLDAVVRGNFTQPLINGQIALKNANLNYASLPNGLSNANGLIRLNGSSANIENLTAESGGGKVTLTGFAGLSGRSTTFNVKAATNNVRVRYSGISLTSNAAITLIGNLRRSLVSGNVVIDRIAYNSSSDAGSLLSNFASTPPSSPTAPSPLLTGMRLNINISTAPDLRVITTYADRLSVEANLTVRGTAAQPGVLGRLQVTDGQLVFFGNTYTVNTGVINFYNPVSIQPNINVSLQTLAQGVDVTLGVTGTMENLQLSYRSDPPLTFEKIVQLLATNTTPNDPNIVANQPPSPQQSFTQMGESAILGQAVANPLASRVQRVFGLSQFKIDPSVSGSNGQPSARVTLEQKIANNITFGYITDVTQTNNQIIRIQWDLTPKLSAVGLRDYNGNVSVQFFYKTKKR